jgi:hypothetical protein
MDVHVLVGGRSVERTARIAARIVGDHLVAVGKLLRERGEHAGIGRPAGDHQEQRPAAADLIIEPCAGNLEYRRFGGVGHGGVSCRAARCAVIGLGRSNRHAGTDG